MLNATQAVEQARRLLDYQNAERTKLDKIRRYWKGKQAFPAVIPSSAPAEVRKMAGISKINVLDVVVDTLAQSLFVDGFRATSLDANNLQPWGAWQANRFDRRQTGVHRAALAYGASYTIVLPGDTAPVIRGRSPRALTALYGEDPDWPMWALERWDTNSYRLYDDEAVYFIGVEGRDTYTPKLAFAEAREHGMGVCPVVRYLDAEDLDADDDVEDILLGQVAPLMELQDQVNLTTFALLVAQHYGAFKQRYILGWVAETEAQRLHAAASRIWTLEDHPDDVEIGELSETSLDGMIKSRESIIRYIATLSQTPVHELIGQMINMAADALAAAEAGRDRKVDERKTGFGESHEQTLQLVGRLQGVDVPDDSQVIWRDTSARAFSATVDALGKLAQMLNVPVEELWERIPGVTMQDVERWKARRAEGGDPFADLTAMLDRQSQVPVSGNGA